MEHFDGSDQSEWWYGERVGSRHDARGEARHVRPGRGEHRYSYLRGAYAGHVSYMPAIVSSVTRDGIVKEVRLAGQDWRLKRRDWRQITVDSASRIADPEAVAAKLVDKNGRAIEYRDHREAVARDQSGRRHPPSGLS